MSPRFGEGKILDRAEAVTRLGPGRSLRLVFTNGCFDLLHAGHVDCLERARRLGKGRDRPLVGQDARAAVVAALECVDWVTLFDEDTPADLIAELRPDFLVKGGDYTAGELPGAEAVRARGGRVVIVPLVPGHSTSALVERIRGGGVDGGR